MAYGTQRAANISTTQAGLESTGYQQPKLMFMVAACGIGAMC